MNATMLNLIACRIEDSFPGEATDLRRIAILYKKMERTLDEKVSEEWEQAQLAEEHARQQNEIYLGQRKARMIIKDYMKLERAVEDGVILPNHDVGADLQRICTDWVNNRQP